MSLLRNLILKCHQQQIIEQAKVTYSPSGKAFEKQTKTIEDKGEKQIKGIQDNRKQLISDDDYKSKLLILKEREIFKDIYNKRLDKLEELNNKIDYDDLKYVVQSSGDEYSFNKVKDPISLLNKIKNVKYARNSGIKFIEDYSSMILEAKKLAKEQEGTGRKILTPNQMLKRLPKALAQIKVGNNSERLLN